MRESHELSSFVTVIPLELFSTVSWTSGAPGSSRCYFSSERMYLRLALDTLASKKYEDQPFLPERVMWWRGVAWDDPWLWDMSPLRPHFHEHTETGLCSGLVSHCTKINKAKTEKVMCTAENILVTFFRNLTFTYHNLKHTGWVDSLTADESIQSRFTDDLLSHC